LELATWHNEASTDRAANRYEWARLHPGRTR